MANQTTTNPFGEKPTDKPLEAFDNTRPTLPTIEEVKTDNLTVKPTEEVKGNSLFSKDTPVDTKPVEPTSYFKYMNGNSTDNAMAKQVTQVNTTPKIDPLLPSSTPLVDEPIVPKKSGEVLPPLVSEVNIQEESNISINTNGGVKKNVTVNLPEKKEVFNEMKTSSDLIQNSGLPPINENLDKPKPKSNILSKIVVAVIVLFVLVLISIPVLSALGTTNNNSLSGLALALPVDNLPIFSIFAKNPKLMIADMFNKPLSGIGNMKSQSDKLSIDMKVKETIDNVETSVSLNMNATNKSNVSGSGEMRFNIGGSVNSNGEEITIDSEKFGIETTTISSEEYYLKYIVGIDVLNLMFPVTNSSYSTYSSMFRNLLSKYNEKYIKFSTLDTTLLPDDPDFFKPKTKSPTSQLNAFMIDQAAFYEEINPKMKVFMANTLVKADKVVEVVNEGRVKVQGVDSIKLRLKFNKDKLKAFQKEFINDLSDFVMNNINPISRLYCASVLRGVDSTSVKTSDIDKCTEDLVNNIKLEDVKNLFEAFNYVEFNNVVVYVNSVNNDLTKLTLNFSLDADSFNKNQITKSNVSIPYTTVNSVADPIEFNIDMETTKSEKETSIVAPDGSIPYKDFLKDTEELVQEIFMLQSY